MCATGDFSRTTQELLETAVPKSISRCPGGISTLSLNCRIPPDMIWFQGHFEGYPVYPGVAELDLVLKSLRHFFDFSYERYILDIPQIKFPKPVLPGCEVLLEAAWNEPDLKCEFRIVSCGDCGTGEAPKELHAAGKLCFKDSPGN